MASSKRSTPRARSSSTTSPARTTTSTSSPTTSTSSIIRERAQRAEGRGEHSSALRALPSALRTVVVALGSNLGDRAYNLRRAIDAMLDVVRIVRISSIHETDPVDAPAGSPPFLNMVILGYTKLDAEPLLDALLAIETRLGRVRRGVRNEPRVIDLDLILFGGFRRKMRKLTVPHPRYQEREFVMRPLREVLPGA